MPDMVARDELPKRGWDFTHSHHECPPMGGPLTLKRAGEPASLPFLCDEKAWTLGENHRVDYLTEISSRVQKMGPDSSPPGWGWLRFSQYSQPSPASQSRREGSLGSRGEGVQRRVTDEHHAHRSPAPGSGCRKAAQDSALRSVAYGGSQTAF